MSNYNLSDELRNRISKIKLIALDLDGTTLTDDKKITNEVKAAIKKAKDKGYHISFLTGRMFGAAVVVLPSLPMKWKKQNKHLLMHIVHALLLQTSQH